MMESKRVERCCPHPGCGQSILSMTRTKPPPLQEEQQAPMTRQAMGIASSAREDRLSKRPRVAPPEPITSNHAVTQPNGAAVDFNDAILQAATTQVTEVRPPPPSPPKNL